MARSDFGGNHYDWTTVLVTLSQRLVPSVQPTTLTFWDAESGGTQHTDLFLAGAPVTSIQAGPTGQVPGFKGPDGVTSMWVDGGAGRVLMRANPPAIVVQPSSDSVAGYPDGTVVLEF